MNVMFLIVTYDSDPEVKPEFFAMGMTPNGLIPGNEFYLYSPGYGMYSDISKVVCEFTFQHRISNAGGAYIFVVVHVSRSIAALPISTFHFT